MERFAIITNPMKDKDCSVAKKLKDILMQKKMSVHICETELEDKSGERQYKYTNPDKLNSDVECIITIGGDGTLIQAARDLYRKNIPIIGVNMGNLGYLAEVEPNSIEEMADRLIFNKFDIENRIMLQGEIYRNGKILKRDISMNDIVIGRGDALRMVDFKVYVNNQYLNKYSADGIIITTPTGSTAYNLSAGGPILEPCADIIGITPICSHTIGSRSIVLSADSEIRIEICRNRNMSEQYARGYFDGSTSWDLCEDDYILIKKTSSPIRLVKLNHLSFVEILHKKM